MQSVVDTFVRPVRDLRISVTDKCNFRCPYCMPAEIYNEAYEFLKKPQLLTYEEICRITKIFVSLGVHKIRLTGGEPLLRSNLDVLIGMLNDIDGTDDLALTTNGYLLAEKAQRLRDAGLQRITVSLDSLDEDIFKRLNGREYSVQKVLEGIRAAEEVGFDSLKINVVVQKGINDNSILTLAERFRGTGHIIRFIEYMDVGSLNGWKPEDVFSGEKIFAMINAQYPLEPVDPNYKGEVAQRFRYTDGGGEIGIIASVTKPFCGACSRARLSIDGKVYTCLFATHGTDLRDLLRSGANDGELEKKVRDIWERRSDRYSELRSEITKKDTDRKKIEMYQIGG